MSDPDQERKPKPFFEMLRQEDIPAAPAFERFCGSQCLTDNELVKQFESCHLPREQWRHADHLRVGWWYIRQLGGKEAEKRIVRYFRAYAASLGAADKYHETMTRAWLRLILVAESVMSEEASLETLLAEHPWLLDRLRVNVFYSPERLGSGRAAWVEPDLRPFPCGHWCCHTAEKK